MSTPVSSATDLCLEGMATIFTLASRYRICAWDAGSFPRACQTESTSSRYAKELRRNSQRISIDANLAQKFKITQHLAGAQHHGRQRIVGNRYWQTGFFADAFVQVL